MTKPKSALRFLRYLVLILLLLFAGVWGWSYYRQIDAVYQSSRVYVWVNSNWGLLNCVMSPGSSDQHGWGFFQSGTQSADGPDSRYLVFQVLDFSYESDGIGKRFHIPLWMPTLLMALLTTWLWYRPFRYWREKRNSVGFEVAFKDDKVKE